MKKKFLLILAAAMTLFVACDKDTADEGQGLLSVPNTEDLNQTAYADDMTTGDGFTFVAKSNWAAVVNEVAATKASPYNRSSWIKLVDNNGKEVYDGKAGTIKLKVDLLPNYTGADRNAKIVISAGLDKITVNVKQAGTDENGNVPDPNKVASITLDPVSMSIAVGATRTITATVLPETATNKNINWTSSDDAVATVDANGMVTAVAAGTATITATSTADSEIKATSEVTVSTDIVAVESVTLDESAISLNVGSTQTLMATILPANASNKNINWTSSNENIATVSEAGLVTAVAAGEVTITATSAADENKKAMCVVTVTGEATVPVESVSLDQTTLSLNVGSTHTLMATVMPENASNKNVTWSTSDAAIATVSEAGLITAVAEGSAIITATTEDGGKTATCTVTVTPETIAVESVTLNDPSAALVVGGTHNLVATVMPENASNKNVTWSSSDTAIATVDENGIVTAVAVGNATITVASVAEPTKTANCQVTVSAAPVAVVGVSLDQTTLSLEVNGTATLVATVAPAEASNKNVTWSSDNTAIATVDANGMVTAVAAGTANITVTTEDGGHTATCAVTVTNATVAVTGVTLDQSTLAINTGATATLVATVNPTDATNKNVTWSSDNTAIATVDANGMVTAVAAGVANITVTTEDGSFTASCEVTVANATVAVTGVTLDQPTLAINTGATATLVATVNPTDATNKNVTWSSDNTAIATVDANGMVTAVAAGVANITVTTEDGSFTASSEVTVANATVAVTGVTLDQSTLSLAVDGTATLVATVNPTDATNKNVTWSSDNTGIATVDANGVVTAIAAGSATITVTTEDGSFTDQSMVTVS